jgi:hypothetical protein
VEEVECSRRHEGRRVQEHPTHGFLYNAVIEAMIPNDIRHLEHVELNLLSKTQLNRGRSRAIDLSDDQIEQKAEMDR